MRVSFVPAPTMSAPPRRTQTSEQTPTTASRSPSSSEVGSPVVASATTPRAPQSSTCSASRASAQRSTAPRSSNGVTSGTRTPAGRKLLLTAGADRVADGDLAVCEHVGAQAAAVHQAAQHPRCGHRLQVGARLAQLDAQAADAADRELPPDEGVQVDTAGEDLAAALGAAELDARVGARP